MKRKQISPKIRNFIFVLGFLLLISGMLLVRNGNGNYAVVGWTFIPVGIVLLFFSAIDIFLSYF